MKNLFLVLFLIFAIFINCLDKSTNSTGYMREDFIGKWNWYSSDSTYLEHYLFTDTACVHSRYFPPPGKIPFSKQQGANMVKYDSWTNSSDSLYLQNSADTARYKFEFEGINILLLYYDSSNVWGIHGSTNRWIKYNKG